MLDGKKSTAERIVYDALALLGERSDKDPIESLEVVQAIPRLNSILVVSQKPEYLKRAQTWIARLDKSDTEGVNLKS